MHKHMHMHACLLITTEGGEAAALLVLHASRRPHTLAHTCRLLLAALERHTCSQMK
jgi:hypothetical protein